VPQIRLQQLLQLADHRQQHHLLVELQLLHCQRPTPRQLQALYFAPLLLGHRQLLLLLLLSWDAWPLARLLLLLLLLLLQQSCCHQQHLRLQLQLVQLRCCCRLHGASWAAGKQSSKTTSDMCAAAYKNHDQQYLLQCQALIALTWPCIALRVQLPGMLAPCSSAQPTLTTTLVRVRLRRKRMPQALHSTGFPFGPLRHWGELTAPQWQQGPARSCFAFLLPLQEAGAAAARAEAASAAAESVDVSPGGCVAAGSVAAGLGTSSVAGAASAAALLSAAAGLGVQQLTAPRSSAAAACSGFSAVEESPADRVG
jgi:hypothetical protein